MRPRPPRPANRPLVLRPLAAMLDRAWGWWFIYQLNAGYARLRRDPAAWAEELEEQRLWDRTLMDGLEDEPPWPQEDIERWMAGARDSEHATDGRE